MPAKQLDPQQPTSIQSFDVVGVCGVTPGFVSHVGLARDEMDDVTTESMLRLIHMKPPLTFDEDGEKSRAHCIGGVMLSNDEQEKIRVFAERLFGEYLEQGVSDRDQYTVIPRIDDGQGQDDMTIRRQFSCASFVIAAYSRARIEFIETSIATLPSVELKTLQQGWRRGLVRLYEDPERRAADLNLVGNGPWPIVMPGYVLNALNRSDAEVRNGAPYRPQSGDEFFPRRGG